MADTLKVLGQSAPGAATLTPLYTVPAAKMATVSSLVACNRGGTATAFRIAVAVGGASDAPAQYLFYDVALPANDTFIATVGVTLGAGDTVRVQGGSANVTFSAFGVEIG